MSTWWCATHCVTDLQHPAAMASSEDSLWLTSLLCPQRIVEKVSFCTLLLPTSCPQAAWCLL